MVGVRGGEQCGGDPKVCPRGKECHVSLTEGDLLEQRPSGRPVLIGLMLVTVLGRQSARILEAAGGRAGAVNEFTPHTRWRTSHVLC